MGLFILLFDTRSTMKRTIQVVIAVVVALRSPAECVADRICWWLM